MVSSVLDAEPNEKLMIGPSYPSSRIFSTSGTSGPSEPWVSNTSGDPLISFCAWALKQAGFAGPITVVEKDPTYQQSSTALSAASIRTQFGTPANVQMSLYAARMFRDIKAVFGDDADIAYAKLQMPALPVQRHIDMMRHLRAGTQPAG